MILVTGGTGLVGSHLLFDLVKKGKKVRAIKREGSSTDAVEAVFKHYAPNENLFDKIDWFTADIIDIHSMLDALEGVDYVYHCAALVSFHPKDKEKLFKINVEGTANLVNAALEKKIKKLCYVSSTAAVGKTREQGKLVNEENKWDSYSESGNYTVSKHLAEMEVWRASEEGLNVVAVNPCLVIGPGKWGESSTSMITSVANGLKFYTEGGNAYVDARDVSRAMIQLMESDIQSERFLLVGDNLTYKTFFDLVANAMGKPAPSIKANRLMSKSGLYLIKVIEFLTGKRFGITGETQRSAHSTNYFSAEKIKTRLGFEFTPIKDAVGNAVEAYEKSTPNGRV